MFNDKCNPDCRAFVLTDKGKRAIADPDQCDHVVRRVGNAFYCRRCDTGWKLTRSTFGGSARDLKR